MALGKFQSKVIINHMLCYNSLAFLTSKKNSIQRSQFSSDFHMINTFKVIFTKELKKVHCFLRTDPL